MKKYNLKFKKALLFMLAIVLFSLTARSAQLTRPLGIHGENASSHVLVTMLSYENNSIESHYFLPIYQLGNSYDRYINNMSPLSLMTDQGNIQNAEQVRFEDEHYCFITEVTDTNAYLIVTFTQKCGATKKQAAYPALLYFE